MEWMIEYVTLITDLVTVYLILRECIMPIIIEVSSILKVTGLSNQAIEKYLSIGTKPNPAHKNWLIRGFGRVKKIAEIAQPEPSVTISSVWEEDNKVFFYRGWLDKLIKEHPDATIIDNRSAPQISQPFQFNKEIVLRDYQQEGIERVKNDGGGLLIYPTGAGKTVTAIKLAAELNLKTLFLVNTDVLVEQVQAEASRLLGQEIGLIKGPIANIRDFTVASVQTLVRNRVHLYKNSFGLVFQDECHLAAAETFQQVLSELNAKYVVGLSGTPDDRTDGLGWLLYHSIGPTRHKVSSSVLEKAGVILKPIIKEVNCKAWYTKREWRPEDKIQHIKSLVKCKKRNEFLVDYIFNLVKSDHNVVVFTELVDHAIDLHKMLETKYEEQFGSKLNSILYHGRLTTKERTVEFQRLRNNESTCTIATYQICGTGLDVKPWTDIVEATPITSPTMLKQSIGRIRRATLGKCRCVVHDIVDINDPLLVKKYKKRLEVYKSL